MKAILFDLDGVLYVGDQIIEGAVETLRWCNARAIPHLFVTNTTSKPRSAIVAKLKALGISIKEDRILTPPVAAGQWLHENQLSKLGLFVSDITRREFDSFTLVDQENEAVDAVVVGDMGEDWSFLTLNRAFRFLMHSPQPRLIALGLTRYWRAQDGLRLDAGAYVAALQYASGSEPVVLGKPAEAFYQSALYKLNVTSDDIIMIGDDIRGDIGGAQDTGIRGVLVRTGKFRESDLESGIAPYAILNSVADLPSWWEKNTH